MAARNRVPVRRARCVRERERERGRKREREGDGGSSTERGHRGRACGPSGALAMRRRGWFGADPALSVSVGPVRVCGGGAARPATWRCGGGSVSVGDRGPRVAPHVSARRGPSRAHPGSPRVPDPAPETRRRHTRAATVNVRTQEAIQALAACLYHQENSILESLTLFFKSLIPDSCLQKAPFINLEMNEMSIGCTGGQFQI